MSINDSMEPSARLDPVGAPASALTFTAHLTGSVNGSAILVSGGGTIDVEHGETDGRYLLQDISPDFHPSILSACMITGYPNASASLNNTRNPFHGKSYSYRRSLEFSTGCRLELRAECELFGSQLKSRFFLYGEARLQGITSIDPLIESWEPLVGGDLRGRFTIGWRTLDDRVYTAEADSRYTLASSAVVEGVLHRYLVIRPESTPERLRLRQRSTLFRRLPDLDDPNWD